MLLVIWYQAMTARKAIVLQFRPRLIVRKVSLRQGTYISTVGEPDRHQWKVEFTIANVGGSQAAIKRRGFEVSLFEKGLPARMPYEMHDPTEPIRISAGQEIESSVLIKEEIVWYFKALQGAKGPYLGHQPIAHMYFWGCVEYADDTNVVRNMAVCRHYQTDSGKFVVIADSDYEYSD